MADEPIRIGFDANKLKFREMKVFEQIAGIPIGQLPNVAVPGSDIMVAIVYIMLKRDNPELTVDEVWEMDLEGVDFNPTQAEPTPLQPLAQTGDVKPRRAKAS